jgi:SAM-dependent methyltransferase
MAKSAFVMACLRSSLGADDPGIRLGSMLAWKDGHFRVFSFWNGAHVSGQDRKSHWETVYRGKRETEVSWYEETPTVSLELLDLIGAGSKTGIIDIGGGRSRLADALLARGHEDVTVLDISETALAASRARLGERGGDIEWIVADVTEWKPERTYEVWHDRAAFHFQTDPAPRAAYLENLNRALVTGGHAIIGTFAPDGPEKCSGLPVLRYDANGLAAALGADFVLIDTRRHDHATPWGAVQRFQFSVFRRRFADDSKMA